MIFEHKPVLLNECIENLDIKPNGIYVDGTLGGAGHSIEILKRLDEEGMLVGIDQDEEAITAAIQKLSVVGRQRKLNCINLYTRTEDESCKNTKDKKDVKNTKDEILERTKEEIPEFVVEKTNFENLKKVLEKYGIAQVDGILLDIGVSSHQIDTNERGFSYMNDAPLDMRMDREAAVSAYNVINEYDEKRLSKIIREYGEENWAARIAKFIVQRRDEKVIESTGELVEIIRSAIPKKAQSNDSHPAKRTFQAIRIEVNRELEVLKSVIADAVPLLKPGGRICVITFHSLEDRIVKNMFRDFERPCTCPKDFPVCVCNKKATLKIISRKPIVSMAEELLVNKRAKSAKLRVAQKI